VTTAVFVQVRVGSHRLPGKALLPLAGATVIAHVMRALSLVPAEVRVLLTDEASAPQLSEPASQEGFQLFVGSPEDVLGRFCAASRQFSARRVIRATGDNPLTSAGLARAIMEIHQARGADLSHYLGNPWGTGVEVVEADALFQAERDAKDPVEREHITTYLYRHPEMFRIVEEQAPQSARMPEARVTIDTPEDFVTVKRIFDDLYRGAPIDTEDIVRWFGSAHA
jgi:spore coat polysaccharide biosynthesis protein SpsF